MNDLLRRRRGMMTRKGSDVLDTSPKIAEYGVCYGPANDRINTASSWCITEWYNIEPTQDSSMAVYGYVGADSRNYSFQFKGHKRNSGVATTNWHYFQGTNPRSVVLTDSIIETISFSIETAKIRKAYAYIEASGQILFAGKDTIYYGYKNINDMPTGE